MPDREQLIEIGAAAATVIVMIATLLWIGTTYGGEDGTLSADGGQVLVGVIVGFIFLLTAVGVVLAYVLNDPEDDLEPGDSEGNSAF